MSDENKKLIEDVLSGQLDLVETLSDDAVWQIASRRAFEGKASIINDLLGALGSLMASMGSMVITNVIAEGEKVLAVAG